MGTAPNQKRGAAQVDYRKTCRRLFSDGTILSKGRWIPEPENPENGKGRTVCPAKPIGSQPAGIGSTGGLRKHCCPYPRLRQRSLEWQMARHDVSPTTQSPRI